MNPSRKIALTGMMCALAAVLMALGGVIPLATFCCPMIAGLTLIPVSIMVYRAQMGAAQPADVFLPILIATFFSTMVGLLVTAMIQRIRFDRVLVLFLSGLSAVVALIIWGFMSMPHVKIGPVSTSIANILLLLIIIAFILSTMYSMLSHTERLIECSLVTAKSHLHTPLSS